MEVWHPSAQERADESQKESARNTRWLIALLAGGAIASFAIALTLP